MNDLSFLKSIPAIGISSVLLFLLGLLLIIGRRLEPALKLEKFGIPIALLLGFGSLLFGPYGSFHLLPVSVTEIWLNLPAPLLTLVFGSLLLGRPLPRANGLCRPVASQALLALLLGFGQYLIGGLVVLLVLIPNLGVNPLMACLIEVGFEGGHGAAAIMGDSFIDLGFSGGADLGLAMATVGLLSSTLIGSFIVIIARWRGWIVSNSKGTYSYQLEVIDRGNLLDNLKYLIVNLGLIGLAVLIGFLLLEFVRYLAPLSTPFIQKALLTFPVFPLALLGSLLIRYILEKSNNTILVSDVIQREIGTIATDLLIATAIATLNIPILLKYWIPISILSSAGLIWNLFGMFIFSKILFGKDWFERSITEFGNATGVAASGLLLLRLSDPRNETMTLPIFSIKQILLQPILSGGIITVFAPFAIIKFGLLGWTEISGILTIAFLIISIILTFTWQDEMLA